MSRDENPVTKYPSDGFPRQHQEQPGLTSTTEPRPDHGEQSYVGQGRLLGRRVLITGGDSGIGRAVAIACAREGADVAISYLPEEQDDAADTAEWVEKAERQCLLLPGDVRDEDYCVSLVELAGAYVFLASSSASYISGAVLPVTGGTGL